MDILAETNPAPVSLKPESGLPATSVETEQDAIHACKILVIDDEEQNVRLIQRVLARAGFDNFVSTTDPREAAALFTDFEPDLVLTDWLMPNLDGCAVIEQLRALTATDDYLPIIVLTADITPQTKKRALTAGATDFLTKPFDQVEVLLRIRNLLRARRSHLIIQRQNANLEESVRQRTFELEKALVNLTGAQKLIIQQERLSALGAMAAGIAHDFNNALSIIMGFGEALLHDVARGLAKENATRLITTILTAAEDAAKIVHRLSEFYRSDEVEPERKSVDLSKLVVQAIALTQPRWHTEARKGGRIITVTAEDLNMPSVSGDAAELREALANLIYNAVDAMPDGGSITLSAGREDGKVVVRISDSGIGMSEEVRQRCLEPFFTTKGKRGTGLGLAMVYGIVQRHNGSIDIRSEMGKGTTFSLTLPAASAEGVIASCALPEPARVMRVLVVDDYLPLCELISEYLRDDLHCVETAFCGSAALEKFRAGDFDLVITDQIMQEMTGERLAVAMKEVNPKVPIILLTAYSTNAATGMHYAGAIDLVLLKPLSPTDLRHAITKLMTPDVGRRPAMQVAGAENV